MTLAIADSEYARDLTDRIKVAVEGTWQLIKEAYTSRAWSALGYANWDDYCTREFGTSRLRLPREERQEVVGSLRDAGLSVRAIASGMGISKNTVTADVSQIGTPAAPDPAPEPSADTVDMGEGVALDDDWTPIGYSVEDDDEPALTEEECEALADPDDLDDEPAAVTGIDGKRYPATKPTPRPKTETAAQRETRVRREQNERDADRLRSLIEGWITFSRLPEREDRTEVLDLLNEHDRSVINDIAGRLGWTL
jgi:hypothetical protein